MPVAVSNLRSVVAQVTRGGGRSVIVSRRNLSSTSRRSLSRTSHRRNLYYFESICESGVSYSNAFTAGLASVVAWQTIQMREYIRTLERDVEERIGLESKTKPQRSVLRQAWQLLSGW